MTSCKEHSPTKTRKKLPNTAIQYIDGSEFQENDKKYKASMKRIKKEY